MVVVLFRARALAVESFALEAVEGLRVEVAGLGALAVPLVAPVELAERIEGQLPSTGPEYSGLLPHYLSWGPRGWGPCA